MIGAEVAVGDYLQLLHQREVGYCRNVRMLTTWISMARELFLTPLCGKSVPGRSLMRISYTYLCLYPNRAHSWSRFLGWI